jgi:hypothetical protein
MMGDHALGRPVCALCTVSAVVLAMASPPPPSAPAIRAVTVEGTAFRVELTDGRALLGRELQGATLILVVDGAERTLRIDGVSADPKDREGDVLLHRLTILDPVTGSWRELCDPDPDGQRWAFPLRGAWDAGGRKLSDDGLTLTCSAGAQGKCVRLGYKPWRLATDGSSLAAYHEACVRMLRADYCGNGQSATRPGVTVDVSDRLGLQQTEAPAAPFEAAWGREGALCVAHARVPEVMSLERLAQTCPRLKGRLGPEVCAFQAASAGRFGDALIFSRSECSRAPP